MKTLETIFTGMWWILSAALFIVIAIYLGMMVGYFFKAYFDVYQARKRASK